MPTSRHRGDGGKRFHEKRAARAASRPPMPPPESQPIAFSKQTVGAVNHLVAATGMSPSQALEEIVACGILSARALHTQLFLGGILSTPLQAAAPPADEPQASAPDPDDVDTRSAEEKLAALRDVAEGLVTDGGNARQATSVEEIREIERETGVKVLHDDVKQGIPLGTSEDESRETPADGTPRITLEDDAEVES